MPTSLLSTGRVGTQRDLLGSDGEFFGTDPVALEAPFRGSKEAVRSVRGGDPGRQGGGSEPGRERLLPATACHGLRSAVGPRAVG